MKFDRISSSYLKWFALPIIIFFVVAIPLSMYLEPITGDLTRIGYWSERDFGWNKPQPAFTVHGNGIFITNPHILVLGDSFSHPNIWQSYLSESYKFEILTYQYKDVGCVDNWRQWVETTKYPNVHTIIIQVVERGFVSLFRNLNSCMRKVPEPVEVSGGILPQRRAHSGFTLDIGYLFPTAMNMIRMSLKHNRIDSAMVSNVPLSTDKLFSNQKSKRLLYYKEDDNKIFWTEKDLMNSVINLKSIQDDLAKRNLRLVILVVPDKSSAYRNYIVNKDDRYKYPDINARLKSAGVSHVNLLTIFQKSVGEIIDFYLPNNTHLGTEGYKVMASTVGEVLSNVKK